MIKNIFLVKTISGDTMNKEIDLKNYEVHTDLVLETIDSSKESIKSDVSEFGDIKVTRVNVNNEIGSKINKKSGNYITIEFNDVTDQDNYINVLNVVSNELRGLINVSDDELIMIIGLGNNNVTPDALGPKVINNVLITNHLYLLGEMSNGFKRVVGINPGVMAQTGIETSDYIKSLVDSLKPSLIIVIDALASFSIERVNKTIQITDTGIEPGSGVGNVRKEISFDTVGVPVIALGVPTVVSAVTIVSDTIEYMTKYFTYVKNNINKPSSKLVPSGYVNYLKEDISDNIENDVELLGKIGTLNDYEKREFIYEILNPTGYNLMVTPKEVDFVIEKLSLLISEALNISIHKEYKIK